MSLFQCGCCGCIENTTLTTPSTISNHQAFDWTGKEEYKKELLCSACVPAKLSNGQDSGFGSWHGKFPRFYAPHKMFYRGEGDNVYHVKTHKRYTRDDAYRVNDEFQLTALGCEYAKMWLKETGQYHLLEKEQSTDGYSLVNLANHLLQKQLATPTKKTK